MTFHPNDNGAPGAHVLTRAAYLHLCRHAAASGRRALEAAAYVFVHRGVRWRERYAERLASACAWFVDAAKDHEHARHAPRGFPGGTDWTESHHLSDKLAKRIERDRR